MEVNNICYPSDNGTHRSIINRKATKRLPFKRRNSFVWRYFRQVVGNCGRTVCECVICNASCVPKNLARHLASHNILKDPTSCGNSSSNNIRSRQSRSFIWKYCTKEDLNHARCHLCQKLLYFGGGNTSNIAKHLRRIHQPVFARELHNMRENDFEETASATASIVVKQNLANGKVEPLGQSSDDVGESPSGGGESSSAVGHNSTAGRKERKGMSYVWKYCEKLSRHSIRCNLCNKTMSFHGTANVITHLQRRHNILGRVDMDNPGNNESLSMEDNENTNSIQLVLNAIDETPEDDNCDEQIEEFVNSIKRRKRSAGTISVVWKYCTRIGRDVVRCKFCKKNLSYQGTSNLQRHLHRMHGVVTRAPKDHGYMDEHQSEILNTDFIWEHCTTTDDNDHVRCNMCTCEFSVKQLEEIAKHLTVVHAVQPVKTTSGNIRPRKMEMNFDSTEFSSGDECDNWNDMNAKKDDTFYDIIEEEPDLINYEDPFDDNIAHEVPLAANPLSPHSSNSDLREATANKTRITFNENSRRLQELSEERLRSETEYFREKAGYYRMQKYLTALQAKKVRIEIERMQSTCNSNFNGGTFATISLDGIQSNLPT